MLVGRAALAVCKNSGPVGGINSPERIGSTTITVVAAGFVGETPPAFAALLLVAEGFVGDG